MSIRYLRLLFISAVRVVNSVSGEIYSCPVMLFGLLVNILLLMFVSIYLAGIQTVDTDYIQNINQQIFDRIYIGSNYFQSAALVLEISIHPIQPAIVWTMFKLNRGFLFRFAVIVVLFIIICCQYEFDSSNKSSNEVNSFLDWGKQAFFALLEISSNQKSNLLAIVKKILKYINFKWIKATSG